LFIGALVAKHFKLFEDFYLFGLWTIGYVKHFVQAKGAGTSDNVSDVIFFGDVVKQQKTFGLGSDHQQLISFVILYRNMIVFNKGINK
jgi:hypothetical protein